MVLAGIGTVILLWIFISALQSEAPGTEKTLVCGGITAALVLVEGGLVSKAMKTDLKKGLVITGWVTGVILVCICPFLSQDILKMPLLGDPSRPVWIVISACLGIGMWFVFYWVTRVLIPTGRQ